MIRITSLRNEESRHQSTQMVFYGRADYIVDIAGLGRLTERIIWEALENTGVPYVEWTARKEVFSDRAVLRLYIEPKSLNSTTERDIAKSFSRELQDLDKLYHHNPYNIYDSDSETEAKARAKLVKSPPPATGCVR